MQISLNNRPENIDKDSITIEELLKIKNFTFKMMVIKVDGILIKKANYSETFINDGSNVEVLHMISGG